MFTANHFILIAAAVAIIVGFLLVQRKYNFPYEQNLKALFCVGIVSEIVKIMCNMVFVERGSAYEEAGTYLAQDSLPFQLCSIQIIFVILLMFFIKNENSKQVLLQFMFPTMCAGAFFSLLIPTEGVAFDNPQTYQYFIYHAYIIAFAINLVRARTIKVTWRTLFRNIALLFGFSVFAIYVNSVLQASTPNFMFVARPPLDNLPILNLNQGWYGYYFKLVAFAAVMLTVFHTPFIIWEKRRAEKDKAAAENATTPAEAEKVTAEVKS